MLSTVARKRAVRILFRTVLIVLAVIFIIGAMHPYTISPVAVVVLMVIGMVLGGADYRLSNNRANEKK